MYLYSYLLLVQLVACCLLLVALFCGCCVYLLQRHVIPRGPFLIMYLVDRFHPDVHWQILGGVQRCTLMLHAQIVSWWNKEELLLIEMCPATNRTYASLQELGRILHPILSSRDPAIFLKKSREALLQALQLPLHHLLDTGLKGPKDLFNEAKRSVATSILQLSLHDLLDIQSWIEGTPRSF